MNNHAIIIQTPDAPIHTLRASINNNHHDPVRLTHRDHKINAIIGIQRAAQIAEANRQCCKDEEEQQIYSNTKKAICNQLKLKAMPEKLISLLPYADAKYMNVEPCNVIDLLTANYETITTDDLMKNEERLKELWDANTPIKNLFEWIKDIRNTATYSAEPISDTKAMQAIFQTIENTGQFEITGRWKMRLTKHWPPWSSGLREAAASVKQQPPAKDTLAGQTRN